MEVIAPTAQSGQRTPQSPLIRCGNELVAVMNISAPLPGDADEEVWARAAMTWPQASSVAKNHRAHIIVATMAQVASPLQEARVVTAVIGGLLDTVPKCSAVMWAARVVRSAEHWKDESRRASAPYPDYPFLLWIDIAPIRTGAGMEAITIGLSSYIEREIEYEVGRLEPSDVLNNVAGLAVYLIEHGNVLNDGDTIGGSETERIEVKHAASARRGGIPVLQIAARSGTRGGGNDQS